MNEQINKLLKTATDNILGVPVVDQKKFAELIVKECMMLNSKELSILAIERLLPLYKEHFGVEE